MQSDGICDITKIDVRDGRIVVHLADRATRAESRLWLTPANAEIYAREILDAVKKLDRQAIVDLIASLRRQAQQIETSLQKAKTQLAKIDGEAQADITEVRLTDEVGLADIIAVRSYLTAGQKLEGMRAGPPTPRPGLAVEVVRVPIQVGDVA